MEQYEEMEMQLWEYIDGACSTAERQRIAALVATDAAWQQKHAELTALHATIATLTEADQPSMRFTKNVMDAIAHTQVAPSARQYINPAIIKGIAAFFLVTIATLLTYMLATTNWHSAAATSSLAYRLDLGKTDLIRLFSGNVINVVIAVNIVLGLVVLDKILTQTKTLRYDQ